MLEKSLPVEQMTKLLDEGKTDLIEKFRSKRTKKHFSAYLVLKKNGRIGFEFPPRPAKKEKSSAK
jgi:DNA topoisomerase-3